MAEEQDKSQQTEDATPKRIEDAKKKGQVASSKEPSTAISFLLIASLSVTGLGAWIVSYMMDMTRDYLSGSVTLDATPKGMQELLTSVTIDMAMVILPVAIPVTLIGMLVSFLVTGPVFTFETMKPKFEKVSPMKGLKRLFSSKSLAEFVKSILKLVIISSVCWFVLKDLFPEVMASPRQSTGEIAKLLAQGSLQIAAIVAFLFFSIALADVIYQRWEHAKSLKMSQKEIRDENKESEGDPQLKGKIRQIQMEQARNRMMADVPKADVVITNPTHIAVALKYDELGISAPKLVASGKGKVAEKIREIARENKIPIRENKPLARSLFKSVKVGEEIPEDLFEAVAVILAEIYRIRGPKTV
ncbi:MAG: flagellar biosynthesis protein FlhB [Mariprofundaceae bacterium]|nr:flagellar biosynthesis protein FlhB [Mariprofundaceae bacterium]